MKKPRLGVLLILILLASFALGYSISYFVQSQGNWSISRKPAVNIVSLERSIQKDTAIVWEREYIRSGKMLVSDFTYKEDLLGKTLTEIRQQYRAENGFRIIWQNQALIIHQRIDDWSPEDKAKLRLKVYQERVAVYKGPDRQNDTLLRVTGIKYSGLPVQIQQAIQTGQYEFANEQALNDALENMDEYQ